MALTGVGTNGTIVAGVDLTSGGQTISIYYRDGVVDYGSNPASNYEQDASKWEMPLWLVSGTSLIDLRTMLTPGSACGWWGTLAGPVSVASGSDSLDQLLDHQGALCGSEGPDTR